MPEVTLKPIAVLGGGGGGGPVTSASITDASPTGTSVLTGNAAAGRAALSAAAQSDLTALAATVSALNWSSLSGKPAVIAAGADAATARAAIGAGTSSLVIGTGAGDAKAGTYQPTAANISDSTAVGQALVTAASQAAARSAIAAAAASDLAAKAETADVVALSATVTALGSTVTGKVGLTGNETIAGVKTFSSQPIVPTPTASGHATPKAYVDTAASTIAATLGLVYVIYWRNSRWENYAGTAITAKPNTGVPMIALGGTVAPDFWETGDIWIEGSRLMDTDVWVNQRVSAKSLTTGQSVAVNSPYRYIIGSSINFPESLSSLESNSAATLDAVRLYNGGSIGSYPSEWAAHAGSRATVVSFKPDMSAIAAGNTAERNKVLAVLAGIPANHDCFVSLMHEPENGDYTTDAAKADYRNAWAWFGDQVHALGNPRIRSCWIMMAYSWCNSSGRDPMTWYPGDAYVDVAGVDTYNEGSLNATQRWDSWGLDLGLPFAGESLSPKGGGYKYGGFANWAENRGKNWMVCEWGTIQNYNAPTPSWVTAQGIAPTKAAWIEHGVDWFASTFNHWIGMTLFNSTGRTRDGESWILSNGAPDTYDAWGRAVRKWKRGDLS